VVIFNHLPDEEIGQLIGRAGVIICRPGYSTIMDLVTLGRNAILVPTPGQTEQEYLARHLSADGIFYRMDQEGFRLSLALQAGQKLVKSIDFQNDRSLLETRINNLTDGLTRQL
jgi:UDP-N-acetylglucosamine:LPS N-acetylglucosamine transferase